MKCIRCGKEMFTSSSNGDNVCSECKNTYNSYHINIPNNCDIPLPQGFGKPEGWICPVCGRGLSPWTSFCPCQSDWKITYGTSTNINGFASVDEYIQYAKEHYEKICEELKQ